jgi:anti-anti-sigma factor
MAETPEFRCDVARFHHRVIVGVRGAVDATSGPVLEHEVRAVLTREMRGVVLDLNYCSSMDGLGAQAIARLREDLEQRGIDLQLTSVPQAVESRLRGFGLIRHTAAK